MKSLQQQELGQEEGDVTTQKNKMQTTWAGSRMFCDSKWARIPQGMARRGRERPSGLEQVHAGEQGLVAWACSEPVSDLTWLGFTVSIMF